MRVGVGLTRVDDHGQPQLSRQPDLRPEHRLLHVARARSRSGSRARSRPPRGRTAVARDLLAHGVDGAEARSPANCCALVRMDTDARLAARARARRPLRLRFLGRIRRLEDDQRPLDAGALGASITSAEVGCERLVGEMAMGIDHWSPDGRRGRAAEGRGRPASAGPADPACRRVRSTYARTRSCPRL